MAYNSNTYMNCRARIYDSLNIPAKDRLGNVKWKDLAKSNEEFPILKHVKGRRLHTRGM